MPSSPTQSDTPDTFSKMPPLKTNNLPEIGFVPQIRGAGTPAGPGERSSPIFPCTKCTKIFMVMGGRHAVQPDTIRHIRHLLKMPPLKTNNLPEIGFVPQIRGAGAPAGPASAARLFFRAQSAQRFSWSWAGGMPSSPTQSDTSDTFSKMPPLKTNHLPGIGFVPQIRGIPFPARSPIFFRCTKCTNCETRGTASSRSFQARCQGGSCWQALGELGRKVSERGNAAGRSAPTSRRARWGLLPRQRYFTVKLTLVVDVPRNSLTRKRPVPPATGCAT